MSANFPINTDPVLVSNLRWAAEENRKVEGIKTIRALIQNEVKNQGPPPAGHDMRISLALCADIWAAFTEHTPPAVHPATSHHHHLKDDAADYDAKLTSAERAAYDAGYNACAAEEPVTTSNVTMGSNDPITDYNEEPEYLLIMFDENNDKYNIHRYYDYDDALHTAEQEIERYPIDVTIARTLATTVTKRTMKGV